MVRLSGYRDRIEARVAELRATPGFTVLVAELAPPASRDVLDLALAGARGRLPVGVEEFCGQLNGFRLEWTYADPLADSGPSDSGAVNLLPVEQIFSDWCGTTWFDSFPGGDRFKPVKPLDLYSPEACAAFWEPDGSVPEDGVYFHYFGEDVAPLGLSFPAYLDLTLATCGYLNWRLALFRDDPGQPQAKTTLDRLCSIIPGFSEGQLPSV